MCFNSLQSGTKGIAIFTIVLSAVELTRIFLYAVGSLKRSKSLEPQLFVSLLTVTGICLILNIITATILLNGAKLKNWKKCVPWVVYTCFLLVINIGSLIYTLIRNEQNYFQSGVGLTNLVFNLSFLPASYFLIIVLVFIRQLRKEEAAAHLNAILYGNGNPVEPTVSF